MSENRAPWTPEPWRVVENDGAYVSKPDLARLRIEELNGLQCVIALIVTDIPQLENQANAARIAACVNACAGIADPDVVKEMVRMLRRVCGIQCLCATPVSECISCTARALKARIDGGE